jgi:hypothetical protein
MAKAYFFPFKRPANASVQTEPVWTATGFPADTAFLTSAIASGETSGGAG